MCRDPNTQQLRIAWYVIINLYVAVWEVDTCRVYHSSIEFDGWGSDIRTTTPHNLCIEVPGFLLQYIEATKSSGGSLEMRLYWSSDALWKHFNYLNHNLVTSVACLLFKRGFQIESKCTWEALLNTFFSFRRPSISGEVWCFLDLTHLPMEEFLGCLVTVEMPGM